jgi:hypothetical protein
MTVGCAFLKSERQVQTAACVVRFCNKVRAYDDLRGICAPCSKKLRLEPKKEARFVETDRQTDRPRVVTGAMQECAVRAQL